MKYRKKPVVIEAKRFEWGMEDGVQRYNEYIPQDSGTFPDIMRSKQFPGYLSKYDDLLEDRGFEKGQWQPYIQTLEGRHFISEGDMIITGVKGERYPCKPDIFEMTYEQVTE